MAQTVGAFTTSIPSRGRVNDVLKRGVDLSTSAAMPTDAANAVVFPFTAASGAMIYVSASCTIKWYAAADETGTVAALYDDASTPVAITQVPAGAGWYAVPAKVFAAPAIAPIATAGTPNFILAIKR